MFGTQYMGFALLIAGQGLTAAVPSVPAEDLGMPAVSYWVHLSSMLQSH